MAATRGRKRREGCAKIKENKKKFFAVVELSPPLFCFVHWGTGGGGGSSPRPRVLINFVGEYNTPNHSRWLLPVRSFSSFHRARTSSAVAQGNVAGESLFISPMNRSLIFFHCGGMYKLSSYKYIIQFLLSQT